MPDTVRALCNERWSYRSRQRQIIAQTRNQTFVERPARRGCGRWQLMIGRRRSLDTDTPLDHLFGHGVAQHCQTGRQTSPHSCCILRLIFPPLA